MSQVSALVPAIAGLVYYRKLNKTFRILTFFFIYVCFIERCATFMANEFDSNVSLNNAYSIVEFIIYAGVFNRYFDKNLSPLYMRGVFIAFVAITAIEMYVKDFDELYTVSHAVASAILITYALLFFYRFFKELFTLVLWKQAMFWFSTSVLIYFSLNFIFFILEGILARENQSLSIRANDIHGMFNIISNILFAFCFIHRDEN